MRPCGSRQHVIGSACCLPGLQICVARQRSDNAMESHASDHPVHIIVRSETTTTLVDQDLLIQILIRCVVTSLYSFTTTVERMTGSLFFLRIIGHHNFGIVIM